ncbi:MAG: prepilin-type N-terminal cleavage/methylation domain-containing protein, partial [Candidatus Omnitrophota bacterium]|nr:prepilin-type N-terminal cleavage/methylation domain-containing protein [Candidatus Omnitrophota bacterium]
MSQKRCLPVIQLAGWRVQPANRRTGQPAHGFTLIEIMLGTSIMVIVLVAMLGSFFGQSTLNQNSRNMM